MDSFIILGLRTVKLSLGYSGSTMTSSTEQEEGQLKLVTQTDLQQNDKEVREKQKEFKCDICPSDFSDHSTLEQHIESVHKNQEEFEGDICQSKFYGQSELQEHIKNVCENFLFLLNFL